MFALILCCSEDYRQCTKARQRIWFQKLKDECKRQNKQYSNQKKTLVILSTSEGWSKLIDIIVQHVNTTAVWENSLGVSFNVKMYLSVNNL